MLLTDTFDDGLDLSFDGELLLVSLEIRLAHLRLFKPPSDSLTITVDSARCRSYTADLAVDSLASA